MAILVTGGAGYIGSHTCIELLNADYEVVIVDNFSNSNPIALQRVQQITGKTIKVYEIDLLNELELERVFQENSIEAVIHFAGLKAVGESVVNPLLYFEKNLISTISLCTVMQKYNVKNIVFSSSATVYGLPETLPITEDFPLEVRNPYGRTKRMIEEMLHDVYISDSSWSISILRYFNPIGAHESGLIGEDSIGIPNNLMPYITKVAIGELKELNVFGNTYETSDGTGVRDYIHVCDLANGHVAALKKTIEMNEVGIFNLGTGRGYSVLEVLRAFESATSLTVPYKVCDPRPGDVAIYYADATRAFKELGWKAKKSLEEMCKDAWRWQLNNPNGYLKRKKQSTSSK
ncbi:UDP-glucose 4-epimerase GalE [Bacillus massiliigorillae]|uniref:UDP-glucose 4-epimerase GalE n=1 Tax=Bacillus massiliigorillae TaxID=1243664 RepID=UPI0005A6AF6E|nr:UDP-glucose 4-epimerase GalE [Bacillus massiliigorillae]